MSNKVRENYKIIRGIRGKKNARERNPREKRERERRKEGGGREAGGAPRCLHHHQMLFSGPRCSRTHTRTTNYINNRLDS